MNLRLLLFIGILIPASLSAQLPDIFVCSQGTHSVKRYDGNTGQFLGDFVTPNSGQINTPREVVFHPNGNLLVTARFSSAIKMYDGQTGAFIGNFSKNYPLDNASKATWGPDGYLYVSQWGITKSRIVRFDTAGNFVDEFHPANLNQAAGHAWDDVGNLYVAIHGEGNEGNVLRFDTAGNAPEIFLPNGFLQGPVNVWFRGGDFYVADDTRGEVIQFDPSNKMQLGIPVLGLSGVEGYAYDPAGRLYVCEPGADQVRRYDIPNNMNEVFINDGGLNTPNSITFKPSATTPVEEVFSARENDLMIRMEYQADRVLFHLKVSRHLEVKVNIYDASGQDISMIFNGLISQGEKTISLNTEQLSSGVYFYKIKSGEAALAGKFMVR